VPSEQQRPDVIKQRADFRARAADWLVNHLKWLDEMGVQLNLTREYGRAVPGQRIVEGVPSNYGSNYTVLATLGMAGVRAPFVFEGALNGESFTFYVEKVLAPTLRPGDILVMDNLPTHKVGGIQELVEACGARIEFLSPYSPDFNPIERCWSKIKTYLRKAKARSYKALLKTLKEALGTIREADIRAWAKFCGYSIQ
jgi:transposase